MKMKLSALAFMLALCLLAGGCGAEENTTDLSAAEALLTRESVQTWRPEGWPQELTALAYCEDNGIAAAIYTAGEGEDMRYIICTDAQERLEFKSYSQAEQGLQSYDNLAFFADGTDRFCFYDRTGGEWLSNVPAYENRLLRAHGLSEETPLLLCDTIGEDESVLMLHANENKVETPTPEDPYDADEYKDIIACDTATEELTMVQRQAKNPFDYALDASPNYEGTIYVLQSDDYDGYRFFRNGAPAGEVSPATLPALAEGGHYAYHYQVITQREGTFRIAMMAFDYRPEQAVKIAADYVEEAYDMGTTWQCVVLDESCQITKCFDTGIPVVWADPLAEVPSRYGNGTVYFNAAERDILYVGASIPQGGKLINSHWAVNLTEGVNAVSRID